MKNKLILIALGVILASSVSAATPPPTAGSLFGPCAESVLKYFPQQKIEAMIGQSVNAVSFAGFPGCMFSPGSTPNSNQNVTVTILSSNGQQISDSIYDTARADAAKNNTIVHEGSNTCSRFFSASRKDGSGQNIGYSVYGQNGPGLFSAGSTKISNVTAGQLENLVDYACGQTSSTNISPSANPAATVSPGNDSSLYGDTNSSAGSVFDSPDFYLYLILGILALVAIIIVLWLFMHHKNNMASDPPVIPSVPTQEPPYVPPVTSQEPPSPPAGI